MKKNTKIKIASADDILNYLRTTAVDGISNKSKKDVARHFGYKSSNGEGFLANFKMLEKEGLIQDISSSKTNGRWKVDMTSSFSAEHSEKKKNNKSIDLNNPLSNVNLEYLNPVDFAGRKYIPLTSVAEALGVDKHAVYNAASSSNRLVFPYTRTILLDGEDKKNNSKKSIEVEGLSFLFDRLKKHVDTRVLSSVVDYVNSLSSDQSSSNVNESVPESKTEHNTTVINFPNNHPNEFKIDEAETTKANTINTDANSNNNTNNIMNTNNSTTYTSTDAPSENKKNAVHSTNILYSEDDLKNSVTDEQTSYDSSTIVDNNDFSDASEMLVILDGILNILSEHSNFKNEVKALKEENTELKKEIVFLKEEEQKLETESIKYLSLKAENDKLKEELKSVSNTNTEILSKANMIKKYILDNKISM